MPTHWSDSEVSILYEWYPRFVYDYTIRKKTLTSLLPNRSWKSILWKCNELGIRSLTLDEYAERYPIKLSDEDKGYIAAMLDGEGSFEIQGDKRRKEGGIWLSPRVGVYNNNGDVIKWIQDTLGIGVLHFRKTRIWTWTVYKHNDIHNLIHVLSSSLKIKKLHSDAMHQFLHLAEKRTIDRPQRSNGLFTGEINRQMMRIPEWEIYKKIRALNQAGNRHNWRKYR